MSPDFDVPGDDPFSGGVFRYGNAARECSTVKFSGKNYTFCELSSGPTGPVSKSVWGPDLN